MSKIKHLPLTTEHLVHVNQNYQVVFIPEDKRIEAFDADNNPVYGNYEVRHRKWDTVEYRGGNLPSCLSVAEHFNDILVHEMYMNELEEDEHMVVDLTTPTGTMQ